jgi:hypothetical protein
LSNTFHVYFREISTARRATRPRSHELQEGFQTLDPKAAGCLPQPAGFLRFQLSTCQLCRSIFHRRLPKRAGDLLHPVQKLQQQELRLHQQEVISSSRNGEAWPSRRAPWAQSPSGIPPSLEPRTSAWRLQPGQPPHRPS